MGIRTGTGDDGTTYNPRKKAREPKDSVFCETLGTLDELSSFIGFALVVVREEFLEKVQKDVHALMGHLAAGCPLDIDLASLESEISRLESLLPPLDSFILPGGSEESSRLHMARSVARRAERLLVRFSREYEVDPRAQKFLNALSDYLFLLARLYSQDRKYSIKRP